MKEIVDIYKTRQAFLLLQAIDFLEAANAALKEASLEVALAETDEWDHYQFRLHASHRARGAAMARVNWARENWEREVWTFFNALDASSHLKDPDIVWTLKKCNFRWEVEEILFHDPEIARGIFREGLFKRGE